MTYRNEDNNGFSSADFYTVVLNKGEHITFPRLGRVVEGPWTGRIMSRSAADEIRLREGCNPVLDGVVEIRAEVPSTELGKEGSPLDKWGVQGAQAVASLLSPYTAGKAGYFRAEGDFDPLYLPSEVCIPCFHQSGTGYVICTSQAQAEMLERLFVAAGAHTEERYEIPLRKDGRIAVDAGSADILFVKDGFKAYWVMTPYTAPKVTQDIPVPC